MQTWTYRFESFTVETEEDGAARLSELGAQGWECFQITVMPGGLIRKRLGCWLKCPGRPVDPTQAELD